MEDRKKSKDRLIREIEDLRRTVATLEESAALQDEKIKLLQETMERNPASE